MAASPGLRRADPPVSPALVGVATIAFVGFAVVDALLAHYAHPVIEGLFTLVVAALTFWLIAAKEVLP